MILFDPQNGLLDLEGQLVRVPVGTLGSVLQPLTPNSLYRSKILYPVLREIPKSRQATAIFSPIEEPGHTKRRQFIHTVTLIPGHLEASSKCCNCVTYPPQNKLKPIRPGSSYLSFPAG